MNTNIPEAVQEVLSTEIDAAVLRGFRPYDLEIHMLDQIDYHAAEKLMSERHGEALHIAEDVRQQLRGRVFSVGEALKLPAVARNTDYQDWLFQEGIKMRSAVDPTFFTRYAEEAAQYFRDHPEDVVNINPTPENTIGYYVTLLAEQSGALFT